MAFGVRILAMPVALAVVLVLGGGSVSAARAEPPVAYPIAAAQSSNPFSALVVKRRERRPTRGGRIKIERYVLASDDRAFLFEQRQNEARVKFLCSPSDQRIDCLLDEAGPAPEIYLLRQTRGPRGDLIYKNAQGDTLLRIASYGGATVFWPGEAQGLAASKSFGDDSALRLIPVGRETALRRARAATATISAITGAPIIFDLGVTPPDDTDATVLADAVMRAAKGLRNVADDPTGARIIAGRIERVTFLPGEAPGVRLNEAVLEIHYVPNLDIAGRPSSVAISRLLEEAL
ncbi:MAG: DUF4908 domain-containing protein [Marinicaulis sp.]|nr:DUF4908 domain-containing protein [Marinicaulis sp.]